MKKIGLFYGPTGGSVERIAQKLAGLLGDQADIRPIKDASASDLDEYDNLILGISTIGRATWGSDATADDWDIFLPQLDKMNYQNKTFALYGLGDHLTYPLHFVDSLGVLGKILMDHNATIVGQVPVEGYQFDESEAVFDNQFIGLPIDEDFEPEKTDERLKSWLGIILPLFG